MASPCSDLGQHGGGLKGAAVGAQQFGQHQLAAVIIEPAQPVGHHLGGHDADAELVPRDAQPLADLRINIAAREAQFVG